MLKGYSVEHAVLSLTVRNKVIRKKQRLDASDHAEIIRLYTAEHLSCGEIAKRYKKQRQTIYKILKANGIDTSKETACNIQTMCDACGADITVKRCSYKKRKFNFCDHSCYADWLKGGGNYIENRSSSRRARKIIENLLGELPYGSIVHHEDGNQWNNHPSNLILFASVADHLHWHRGQQDTVTPLWNGTELSENQAD